MKSIKNLFSVTKGFFFSFLILLLLSTPAAASEIRTNQVTGWPQGPAISCVTAVLYDADTDTILYDKGMDTVRYPASTTKIMTALLAIENCAPDTVFTLDENACTQAVFGSTNIHGKVGEQLTLDQCLHAILLASANEVSTQVAETISGSVEAFAALMNQRAAELGCTNTHFHNANGLPDEEHWTSAHDLALILAECIKNPAFVSVMDDRYYTIPPTNMTSEPRSLSQHHVMMLEGDWLYEGVFAGKTGYTDAAGQTLVTACKKDGRTLICVVMGGSNPAYFTETASLLDYGYQNFTLEEAVNSHGMPLNFKLTVPKGVSLSELTCLDTRDPSSGDSILRTYYMGQTKLGSGLVTEQMLKQLSPEEVKQRRIKILLTVLIVLFLLVFGGGYFLIQRRVKEERRFNAEMRKKYR